MAKDKEERSEKTKRRSGETDEVGATVCAKMRRKAERKFGEVETC